MTQMTYSLNAVGLFLCVDSAERGRLPRGKGIGGSGEVDRSGEKCKGEREEVEREKGKGNM